MSSTKTKIMESFVRLLSEKQFDKITVREIVTDCGINRNTFYYYFNDIYDLVEEILRIATEEAIEKGAGCSRWEKGFIEAAEFALQNKKAIFNIYNSNKRNVLEKYLSDITEALMIKYVDKVSAGINSTEADRKLIAAFYKNAVVGYLIEWLQSGMETNAEFSINRLGYLLDGNIEASLKKSEKRPV